VEPSDGAEAVRLARAAVEYAVGHPHERDVARGLPARALPDWLDEPRGVFVTLKLYPSGDLRGCIGFPLPIFPLRLAIPRAAGAAAVEDPRFPPVRAGELASVTVEVSVLTVPEPLPGAEAESRLAAVRVGTDGLIVDARGTSGLLLPQVALEEGWDARQLLEGTCRKAGLPRGAWKLPEVRVRRFQAEIFGEERPGGPIEPRTGR
jgi:uncharacterized protein